MPWAVRFPSGGFLPRHPSQLYEAFFEGIFLFCLLNGLWRVRWVRTHTGFVSGVFALFYGICRISMEQFREPDAHMGFFFEYFTMGQLLSIPFIVIGIWAMFYAWRKKQTVL